jgi:hypothetical protein
MRWEAVTMFLNRRQGSERRETLTTDGHRWTQIWERQKDEGRKIRGSSKAKG